MVLSYTSNFLMWHMIDGYGLYLFQAILIHFDCLDVAYFLWRGTCYTGCDMLALTFDSKGSTLWFLHHMHALFSLSASLFPAFSLPVSCLLSVPCSNRAWMWTYKNIGKLYMATPLVNGNFYLPHSILCQKTEYVHHKTSPMFIWLK